jgi:hypothetical protein
MATEQTLDFLPALLLTLPPLAVPVIPTAINRFASKAIFFAAFKSRSNL